VGQSEEEISHLKNRIEKETGLQVEVINVLNEKSMKKYPDVDKIMISVGYKALPIITLNSETVSMGDTSPEQAILSIRKNLNKK
jgi:hypothetical protein